MRGSNTGQRGKERVKKPEGGGPEDPSAGATVVLRSAGLRQAFEVRSRRLVPQSTLVDESWIFEASGRARLTLVTCAPPYDADRGGYQNLAVVTAVPLGPPEES